MGNIKLIYETVAIGLVAICLTSCSQTASTLNNKDNIKANKEVVDTTNKEVVDTTNKEVVDTNCDERPSVITSSREFIRIRHRMRNPEDSTSLAIKWCKEQNMNAQKTKSSCSDGCCVTAYQCR